MTQQTLKFIDLFCGIGGFHLALKSLGNTQCVFSADKNEHACQMYEANFGVNPYCDISTLDPAQIPQFDILCAGFPCQAFSIAGKKQGFNEARGTLFFDICRIAQHHKPCVLLLENVKHLLNHDKGHTFEVIKNSLDSLGYYLSYQVLDARNFGVAQSRLRVIMVAVRKDTIEAPFDFSSLAAIRSNIVLADILEEDQEHTYLKPQEYTLIQEPKAQPSGLIFEGYLNKRIRGAGVRPGTEHLSRVHRQCNRIYSAQGVQPTISSQESAGRFFVNTAKGVRKLTLNECFSLMGFPKSFKQIGSNAQLYQRIGNSVCVPMMEQVAKEIVAQVFTPV